MLGSSIALLLLGALATGIRADSTFNQPDLGLALAERMSSLSPADAARFHHETARSSGVEERAPEVESYFTELRERNESLKARSGRDHKAVFKKRQTGVLPCKRLGGWAWGGLTNPANCMATVATKNIDDPVNGLLVGTVNGWDSGKVPPAMRGIFYMEGNPYGSETFSTGSAYVNPTTGTTDIPVWQPRVWATDVGVDYQSGHISNGQVYQNNCTANPFTKRLKCAVQALSLRTGAIAFAGDYAAEEISDNYWLRSSDIKGMKISDGPPPKYMRYYYNMYRLVDQDGKRTPYFNSRYLANVNRTIGTTGQLFVHLKDYQDVPQRR